MLYIYIYNFCVVEELFAQDYMVSSILIKIIWEQIYLYDEWWSQISITSPGQNRPRSNGNEGVLYTLQSCRTVASLSGIVYCHTQDIHLFLKWGILYPSMEYVHHILSPADWMNQLKLFFIQICCICFFFSVTFLIFFIHSHEMFPIFSSSSFGFPVSPFKFDEILSFKCGFLSVWDVIPCI